MPPGRRRCAALCECRAASGGAPRALGGGRRLRAAASGQQGQATTDDAVELASRRPRTDVELLGEGASARLVLAHRPGAVTAEVTQRHQPAMRALRRPVVAEHLLAVPQAVARDPLPPRRSPSASRGSPGTSPASARAPQGTSRCNSSAAGRRGSRSPPSRSEAARASSSGPAAAVCAWSMGHLDGDDVGVHVGVGVQPDETIVRLQHRRVDDGGKRRLHLPEHLAQRLAGVSAAVRPQRLGEGVAGKHPLAVEHEVGQQLLRPTAVESGHRLVIDADGELAECAQFHTPGRRPFHVSRSRRLPHALGGCQRSPSSWHSRAPRNRRIRRGWHRSVAPHRESLLGLRAKHRTVESARSARPRCGMVLPTSVWTHPCQYGTLGVGGWC